MEAVSKMTLTPQDLALFLALCAGSGNAAGGLLVARSLPGEDAVRRSSGPLAALTQVGAGILIAVALLEFVPVTLDTMRPRVWAAPLILLGYLLVHVVEYTIVPYWLGKSEKPQTLKSSAPYSLVMALIVHSFFDGVAIGAAALLSTTFGGLVFAAILMHKFPVGATLASVVLSAGGSRRAAVGSAALVGASTVVGALLIRPLHAAQAGVAVGIGGGVMLYVAATELIPAGSAQKKGLASVYVLSGVVLFAVTDFFVRKAGLQ
jgi:zinc transporter ZupT